MAGWFKDTIEEHREVLGVEERKRNDEERGRCRKGRADQRGYPKSIPRRLGNEGVSRKRLHHGICKAGLRLEFRSDGLVNDCQLMHSLSTRFAVR